MSLRARKNKPLPAIPGFSKGEKVYHEGGGGGCPIFSKDSSSIYYRWITTIILIVLILLSLFISMYGLVYTYMK